MPGVTRSIFAIFFLVCVTSYGIHAQNIEVSGVVTDALTAEPLIGANVLIKGSNTGTTTDIDGTYAISVPPDAVLIYSYLGYIAQEIPVDLKTDIDVDLNSDITGLEEVVVIGYGKIAKKDLTGSVSSVTSEAIKSSASLSADQALQGRAAGVVVQQNSGEPGAGTTVRIRGTSSISAGNEPLYVIDGIPVLTSASDVTSSAAKGTPQNPLSTINPNDISSIEVLKDASAAAIYGARAANGVILITTKRGEAGNSSIDFSIYHGIQEVRNPYTLLNATQFAQFQNEASFYAGQGRIYSDPSAFGEGTNWQDEVFRRAPMSNYELSFKGGSEQIQYAISGGYYQQDGIIVGSSFDRYNFRANLDGQISPKLKISNNLMFSYTDSDRVATDDNAAFDGGTLTAALGFSPLVPVRRNGNLVQKNFQVDGNGELIDGSQIDEQGNAIPEKVLNTFANPLLKLLQSPSELKTSRIINNLTATYQITADLDFKVSVGVDFSSSRGDQFTPRASRSGGESFATSGAVTSTTLLNENTLNYQKTFNKHKITGVVGVSAQQAKISSLDVQAIDITNDQLGFNNYAITRGASLNTSFSDFTFLSGLARLNYSFNDRYLLTVTGRSDGSSKFGANNKWGFFPSASLGWVISEEDFIQNSTVFDFLKLRLGYGVIGNESIGPYLSQALLIPVDLAFNDVLTIGFEPFIFPNSDLRWESTEQLNIGLDISSVDGRISATADYYLKNTYDLLLSTDVPLYSGFSSVFSNVGDLKNEGLELSITSHNFSGTFLWDTDFNIAWNKNTITNLAGRDEIPNNAGLLGIDSWALLKEGEAVGRFFGLETDGIVQIGEDVEGVANFASAPPFQPGDRKFIDQNGDGLINGDDRTFIGSAQPDFSFGVNNTFSFKGFDLNVFIQGVSGNEIVNFNKFLIERQNGTSSITLEYFANRWTPQNPTDRYPKVNADPGLSRTFISDAEVEDGSYLRLKTVTLGYQLSSKLLDKLRLANAKIYLTGKNLYTLTNYSGFDPEVSHFGQSAVNMGADLGGYPSTRSFILGVNIGF
ncbi:MAG: TonB-dependent receptor [Saprospiraceae bacterium]|nr:TonB-dependent receptor [Saprospiraceae bacterium]